MKSMNDFAAYLREHDDYVVLAHVNPDGDAVGSCIAAANMLLSMGKRAFVYLDGGIPARYADFEYSVSVTNDITCLPFEPRTALVLDISDYGRMGAGKVLYERCMGSAMLDHHETNPGFGEAQLIDGDAAALGELLIELCHVLDVKVSREMAQWLYVAISTDSGHFSYSNTTVKTMAAAAECLRAGIDVDAICRILYGTRSLGRTRLLGLALVNMVITDEGQIAYSKITQKMFDEAGALQEDTDEIVNYLLEVRGVSLAILAIERGKSAKLSVRSKPPMSIAAKLTVPLGGGGHACAAGVTLNMSVDEAIELALIKGRELLK